MIDFGISRFFSDIKNVFSRSRVLGVDIGTTAIKIIEVSRKGEVMKLENYGILETQEYLKRGNAALQTRALKLSERDVLPALEMALTQMKPRTTNAVASIPSFSAFFVPIETPELPKKEAASALLFQARQYVPIPMDEVSVEWIKIEDFKNEKGQSRQRYLLTAVPLATIEVFKSIFKKAGLKLSLLEVETKPLIRALMTPTDPVTQIVDIGSESSGIYIVEGGIAKRITQLDSGAASLTRSLGRTLDISAFRSESLKRRRGLAGSGGEYEISRALIPFIDIILSECARVRVEFERSTGKKVREILVTGGGANLLGINDHITQTSGVTVRSSNALKFYETDAGIEPIQKELSHSLGVASGLALKFFE